MSDEIYRQIILDHYRHPRNFGALKHPTHAAGLTNVSCGDAIRFEVCVKDKKITDIAFSGSGCAVSISSASLVSEYVKGKSLKTAQSLTIKDIEKLMRAPISSGREKCALMAAETLQQLEPVKSSTRQQRRH